MSGVWSGPDWRIECGDCLELLKTLPSGSVDCVVTDPPYGVGKAEWDSDFPLEWIKLAEYVAPRMLTMPGNTHLHTCIGAVSNYKDCIALFALNGMTRSAIAFGNWIPVIASGDWVWKARQNLHPFVVDTSEQIDHPSPKPLSAMKWLIEKYTNPGDTILDPFMGSATTGVACLQTGRKFIGFELDRKYCELGARRLADVAPLFRPPSEPQKGAGLFAREEA